MGEGRLCDMINKVETRTVVTVDSICIQAYLVFKAGGGKKKKEEEEKNPDFHHKALKIQLHNKAQHAKPC